jgi:small subunit ribosomal protein S6
MNEYELTYIVHPDVDETQLAAIEDKVKDLISSNGGQLLKVENWGRRQLAYPIKKVSEGQYVFVLAQLPPQLPRELENQFRINESVLRHLLIRKDD